MSIRNTDRFLWFDFDLDDCILPDVSTDNSNEYEDTSPSSRPRCCVEFDPDDCKLSAVSTDSSNESEVHDFDPFCHSILTLVTCTSASSNDDSERINDNLKIFGDKPECIDGLIDDASVAALDSSQSVPLSEPKSKK